MHNIQEKKTKQKKYFKDIQKQFEVIFYVPVTWSQLASFNIRQAGYSMIFIRAISNWPWYF